MKSMTQTSRGVIGGIDTHSDVHVAAVIDATGQMLGYESFATTTAGYRLLLEWLRSKGDVVRVGVEGTGSWGAGIGRFLTAAGIEVIEVDRANRQRRRRSGKSDPVDAEAAARAVLAGEAAGTPKTRTGSVEAIRALRVAKRSAMSAKLKAIAQIKALIVTGPDDIRARLRSLRTAELVSTCARLRPGDIATVTGATKLAIKERATRTEYLDTQLAALNHAIADLVELTCPELLEKRGIGHDTASILLVTAGDNPHRLRTEASFAKLCGVCPLEASSGKVIRHRLNRTGDRQANHALWRIVLVRMGCDPRTRTYVQRRQAEGLTTREIMRCLKRYVAREIYPILTRQSTQLETSQAA